MKNRIFATLSFLTLFTAAAAFAQSGRAMSADIPFEFHVGTTILPAGHYDLNTQIAPGALSINCYECKAGAMILTNGVYARKTPEKATLVFNRYGNTYFLSRVWKPGNSLGQELRISKSEREFARGSLAIPPVAVALASR